MSNTLLAIHKFIETRPFTVLDTTIGEAVNRANSVGENLERFIADLFKTDCLDVPFSYTGTQNNPPDLMLRGGDAIEVKKFSSSTGQIHFNSSHPKVKLDAKDPRITQKCKDAEDWTTKDMLYAVGQVENQELRRLWLVYGDVYFADEETYTRVWRKAKDAISDGIGNSNITTSTTKEIGRFNKVDSLGLTSLRIRGMWMAQRPEKAFPSLGIEKHAAGTEIFSLMSKQKYESFPDEDILKIESMSTSGFDISEVLIPDPNNQINSIECKFIQYRES